MPSLFLVQTLKGKFKYDKSRFKEHLNTLKTAGIVKAHNLLEKKYELLEGSILVGEK